MKPAIFRIENIELFINSMKALSKATVGAKITINKDGVTSYSRNDVARISLNSNAVKSLGDDIEFSLNNFSNFLSFLKLIKDKDKSAFFDFKYNGSFISYKSTMVNLKLMTIRDEIISEYIDKPITSEINDTCVFETTYAAIRELITNKGLISSDLDSIKYVIEQDPIKTKMVYATLQDLENPLSNSLKLFFANIVSGGFSEAIHLNTPRIQLATILNTPKILIKMTDKNVVIIELTEEKDEYYTNIKLYTSLLKY